MSLKQLAILVVVLAAIAGAGWWLSKPKVHQKATVEKSANVYSVGTKLVTPELLAKVTAIDLYAKDAESPSVSLAKLPDANHWVVANQDNVPVAFDKLADFVKIMNHWRVVRTFPLTEANRERLELGTLRVILKDSAGNVVFDLNIGKVSPIDGSFVILNGNTSTVIETNSSIYLDTIASNWVERRVATIKASDVKEFTINFANGAGSIHVSREKSDGEWTTDIPEGKVLNPGAVTRFVTAVVETVSITDIPDRNTPAVVRAQEVAHECEFVTFDGKRYTIKVGRDPGVPQPEPSEEDAEIPAWAEGVVESEPKPAPAPEEPRYVYATYVIEDSKNAWASKAPDYAFRVSEYTHNQIPTSADGFFLDKPKPVKTAVTPPVQVSEEEPAESGAEASAEANTEEPTETPSEE